MEDELYNLLSIEHYKPHQILFSPGQIENRICFIEAGVARNYYYDNHGNEQTVKFWRQGDVLFSYQGYWSQPGAFYTEILEDAVLVTLTYSDLKKISARFPEVSLLIKTVLLKFHEDENQKQKLNALSAEERFKEMLKHNRPIFQKVPVKIIASYLNMSRETLSRLISKS